MRFQSFFEMISYYAQETPKAPALHYESGGVLRTMSFAALRSAVIGRAVFM